MLGCLGVWVFVEGGHARWVDRRVPVVREHLPEGQPLVRVCGLHFMACEAVGSWEVRLGWGLGFEQGFRCRSLGRVWGVGFRQGLGCRV